MDTKGLIIDYNNKHSCIVDKNKLKTLLIKDEARKTIYNIGIIYNIKNKDLYDTSLKKLSKEKVIIFRIKKIIIIKI